MKQELYKSLSDICEKKLAMASNDEVAKYQSIKKILSHENCFEKINFEIAMNILFDLGFEKNQALEIYQKLIEE